MSLFRTILASLAAIAIASPAFAEDPAMQMQQQNDNNAAAANAQEHQASANASAAMEEKININKANAKDLMKVKGINAAKARAIVAYRKKHAFTSTAELSKVKGFKNMKSDMLKEIEEQVSID